MSKDDSDKSPARRTLRLAGSGAEKKPAPRQTGALAVRKKTGAGQTRTDRASADIFQQPRNVWRGETQPAASVKRQDRPAPASLSAPVDGIRLNKRMADLGLCSRREADDWISKGWVFVNGEPVEMGQRVQEQDAIHVDKAAYTLQEQQVTFLLNKPVGYVSGQPEDGHASAASLLGSHSRWRGDKSPMRFLPRQLRGLAPAGRLDIDSTGLLVLTQDGRVARQLIGESSTIDKEYLVRVTGRLDEKGLALLNHGLSLDGKPLKPAKVEWLNADQLRFILNEGRKRQIRRMCELVGLKVIGLKRVRMGRVRLGDLPQGRWRYLREDEVF